MFTTPKKKSGNVAEGKTANGDATIVFENGTILGAVSGTPSSAGAKHLVIPEIVISASYSSNSLHRSRCDVGPQQTPSANSGGEDNAIESTALLEQHSDADQPTHDEFEQFVLNRTTSDSNILESSIYSELQFAPSAVDGVVVSGGPTGQVPAPQQPSSGGNVVVDVLNSSVCSRDSRQGKRTRRKHKSKSKCSVVSASGQRANVAANVVGATYPPQYTAIFLDHHHGGGAANAMGQIASAAASSPFLNAPLSGPADPGFLHHQQYQFYQQRPMLSSLGAMGHHHHHHRPLLEADVQQGALFSAPDGSIGPGAPAAGVPVPTPGSGAVGLTITAPTSTISPPLRASFRKWFSRPSLPFVIGILALGGVACTLGGIVLGSTGLIEHSTQYLSAALLMIGIGVSLLVISGAIWRLSIPDDVDECPCYRHMETCRNCNSPYCNNRLLPGSYLYPEFQHRPPPPSYLTSLNECAAMGLLFHPGAQPQQPYSTLRMNTPPPLYRSTNSLSVYPSPGATPSQAAHSAATSAAALPAMASGVLPDHSALTMSVVMENLQAQTQPLAKEIHYLELD